MRRVTISGIRIRRKAARITDVLVSQELTSSGYETGNQAVRQILLCRCQAASVTPKRQTCLNPLPRYILYAFWVMSLPRSPHLRSLPWQLAFSVIVVALSCRVAPAQAQTKPPQNAIAYFTDVARKAGLTAPIVFGGQDTKKYIIETTGTGAAVFDYDNDGWPDIFLVNGTTLEGFPAGEAPTNHLYPNNHDGTFTDVSVKAGLDATGSGHGACAGGVDNA